MIPYYEKKDEEIRIFSTQEINFPPHLHAQLELLYLTGGMLEVLVNQEVYLLKRGDFIAIFPNSVHSYKTPVPVKKGAILFTIAMPSLTGEFARLLQKNHPESPIIRHCCLHRDIRFAMKSMQEEYQKSNPCLSAYPAYLQLILARSLPCFTLIKNTDGNYFDLTYRVVHYVSSNFAQPLSLESMAHELGVSKYHLSRIFSEKLHTSFSDYLGRIRVNHARSLLRTTEDSVTKIAFDCGFESQRTFNRVFHEVTGTSPTHYRNTLLL